MLNTVTKTTEPTRVIFLFFLVKLTYLLRIPFLKPNTQKELITDVVTLLLTD